MTSLEKRRDRGLVGNLVRFTDRARATVSNAAEWIRYGGLETPDEHSPYQVVAEQRTYRLRHYFHDEVPAGGRLPIVLVHPLMLTAEVWDVSADTSAVLALHKAGIDVWSVDFGRPEKEPGGLERTLTDHVLAVSDAIDRVTKATGSEVVLAGYSQGGMFSYQAAAYRRNEGIDSIVTFGSPVDTRAPLPLPISPETAARVAQRWLSTPFAGKVGLTGFMTRTGFKLLDPVKYLQNQMQFLLSLHDREKLLPREAQRRFLDKEGFTSYAGPAIEELLRQFVVHNRMLEGGFEIADRLVTLADIARPILTFVGTTDAIGHPLSVRAIRRAAPQASVYEATMRAGHFGLVVGSKASQFTWPNVAAWMLWRSDGVELPETIKPADQIDNPNLPIQTEAGERLQRGVEVALGGARAVLDTATEVGSRAKVVAREGSTQLPRLRRLQSINPDTRISLGLMLDEVAARAPQDICFLFGDRAHRQADVKHRVDSVVKGLLSVGIRQGDRVGILMTTRPSAFTVIAAVSRLGAAAVLLRPDGVLDIEARLGGISWLVSDPEHAVHSSQLKGVTWCVLGGGTGPRQLPEHVVDMERIDPDTVTVPSWYRPNPQRAVDVAFVLFSGEGTGTQAITLSNKRWAISALGTASAAALRSGDTVYSVTPLYHSSALLMSVGGAVAAGARFALATNDSPETFWEEVRRYGASHVSYTWTSLRAVTYGPPQPGERFHPIRLFIGSGMPRNLWRRVERRFAPARVLEFYASTTGEAILANIAGGKIGSMGRRLPGTPEVRVAAYDVARRQLVTGPDGLGREARAEEIGLLVARVEAAERPASSVRLRSVFSRDDAWESTGDLFFRDEDGDLWLVDPVDALIDGADGPVPPTWVRNALGTIPAVDLCVVYGVEDGDHEAVVATLTTLPDTELTTRDLDEALAGLDPGQRPSFVKIVDAIPVTTWHRPLWSDLTREGMPTANGAKALWKLDPAGERYAQIK